MKVALVYDRVNKWGGAERTLLTLHEIFPDAPLYTSVYDPKKAHWAKVFPKVKTSFLQKLPFIKSLHELFGWLMPLAFGSFDFSGYDLVISVTSEAAKGIVTKPGTKHLCYCLTPTRYLWSAHDFYFKNPPVYFKIFPFFWTLSRPFVNFYRVWDKKAAKRPTQMIAISTEVKRRIKKYYGRDSVIVFPPVSIKTKPTKLPKKDFYLLVGRLVPYKRADLAIKVFNRLGYPLYVVGAGSEEAKLKGLSGKNIKFLGEVTDKKLYELFTQAKALVMPQEEDFGIVSVEAQALGTPVIAFNKGGATDTVIDGKTGILFDNQTVEGLIVAVVRFEKSKFVVDNLYTNAKRFSKETFKSKFKEIVSQLVKNKK